jgi:uridine phosphorylase
VSLTSAGQVAPAGPPPYFVVIDRALRDEGTSYHYLPTSEFANADPELVAAAAEALAGLKLRTTTGPSWSTDAPFRETAEAIEAARAKGILAVEMEAAALYAFARAAKGGHDKIGATAYANLDERGTQQNTTSGDRTRQG